jgi:hypothetical protein
MRTSWPSLFRRPGGPGWVLFLCCVACGLPGCEQAEIEAAPVLRLEQVRPRRGQRVGVFLNEALVFHFSAPIDPVSVTWESLAVRTLKSGISAQGRFEVQGHQIRFLPDLGRKRDLTDGGLVPGQRYEILLRGFPSPDGLRAVDGRMLARSHRIVIETVALSEPRGQLFDDHSPLLGEPLLGSLRRVERGGSLILRCAEPLDPSTLADGEFILHSGTPGQEPIPLDLALLENSHKAGARLELKPRRRLAAGRFVLASNLDVSLRDFGGNRVWYASSPGAMSFEVFERGEARPEYHQSFTKTDLSLPFAVPGVDGTATWAGDGRVTLRLPRAAGSGADGALDLVGAEGRRDVQATRLDLGPDAVCELLSVPSLVVLRAQGRMTIAGNLRRRSGEAPAIRFRRGEDLSAWLERARQKNHAWTVLIAGGDLVIDGHIDVEGPLLLVAGGRLRVAGEVRSQEHQLYRLGEGGGPGLRGASPAALVLDDPFENPLQEPMTVALVSGPMPPEGGVERWIGAEVELLMRGGHARVRYMPEDFPLDAPVEEWGVVDDPSELLSADALRLFIELTMEPARDGVGGRWSPPLVDEVRLFWEARER